jgi:hypothetical protein
VSDWRVEQEPSSNQCRSLRISDRSNTNQQMSFLSDGQMLHCVHSPSPLPHTSKRQRVAPCGSAMAFPMAVW